MTTTRTHFTFRVDTWTPDGESIVEHVAGVEDYQVVPRRLRTLARHLHHIAAGCASDRGQPPPARGVESIKSTTFREAKKAPASLLPGLQVCSLVSLRDRSPRRSDFYPKAQSHKWLSKKCRSSSFAQAAQLEACDLKKL